MPVGILAIILAIIATAVQYAIYNKRLIGDRPTEVTPKNLEALEEKGWAFYINLAWPLDADSCLDGLTHRDLLVQIYEEFGSDNVLLGVPRSPKGRPDWHETDMIGVYVWSDEGDDGWDGDDEVPDDPDPYGREAADQHALVGRAPVSELALFKFKK